MKLTKSKLKRIIKEEVQNFHENVKKGWYDYPTKVSIDGDTVSVDGAPTAELSARVKKLRPEVGMPLDVTLYDVLVKGEAVGYVGRKGKRWGAWSPTNDIMCYELYADPDTEQSKSGVGGWSAWPQKEQAVEAVLYGKTCSELAAQEGESPAALPANNIPEGSKVYPDRGNMAIQYEAPDGDMKILNVFGDEYDDNWIGETDKLLELISRNDLKFMFWGKQLDGKKWLYTIVLDWLKQWGPTDDEEDDRMVVMTEEAEDDLLDLLDKLTDYKG